MIGRDRKYGVVAEHFIYHISLMYDSSFELGVEYSRQLIDSCKGTDLYKALLTEFASRLNNKYFVFYENSYFIFCDKRTHYIVYPIDIYILLKSANIQELSKLVNKIHPKKIAELVKTIKKEGKEWKN